MQLGFHFPMSKHLQPEFDPSSAAAWNEIIPEEGESVFNLTIYQSNPPDMDLVRKALAAGSVLAPPGQKMGHTLIYAVWKRDLDLLKLLLEHGFDPNQLAYTAEGDVPSTALDAVADSYHECDDKADELALNAMERMLRNHHGCFAYDLEDWQIEASAYASASGDADGDHG